MEVSVTNDKFSIKGVIDNVSVTINATDAIETLKIADVKELDNKTEITYKFEENKY